MCGDINENKFRYQKKVNIHDHFDNDYRDDSAKNYQKYFVPVIGKPIAADLIKIADIESGENVVDVACGTGVAAILAKEKTGKNGTVAGVDLNPGMLDVARSVTPENVAIDWGKIKYLGLSLWYEVMQNRSIKP